MTQCFVNFMQRHTQAAKLFLEVLILVILLLVLIELIIGTWLDFAILYCH